MVSTVTVYVTIGIAFIGFHNVQGYNEAGTLSNKE